MTIVSNNYNEVKNTTVIVLNNKKVKNKKIQNTTINDLPEEILVKIFGSLTLKNLAQIKRVTAKWNSVSEEIFKLFPLPKNWKHDDIFKAKIVTDLIIRVFTKNPEEHIRNCGNRAEDGEEFIVFTEQGVGLPERMTFKSIRKDKLIVSKTKKTKNRQGSLVAMHYAVTETKVSQTVCLSRFEKNIKN